MRPLLQPYRTMAMLLGLLFVAGTTVLADIRIYERLANGDNLKVGVIDTDSRDHVAVLCSNGVCSGVPCSGCHAQKPAYSKYTRQEHELHLTRYFPRMELHLAEGQETMFAGQKLRRERGRLVFVDAIGGKRPLPAGAVLLKGNTGQPFAIISSDPPE